MEGVLRLRVLSWVKQETKGAGCGPEEGKLEADGPRLGGSREEGVYPPGKNAGKGLGRKERRAQGGWGVGARLGGAEAEYAPSSSLATPVPGREPPAPRPAGRTPAREPQSWASELRVRPGDPCKFCFCLNCFPGSQNVASLRALCLWTRERVFGANSWVRSWSSLRQHDQPRGRAKQGNRLPESRSAKTGKRETGFRPVPASNRRLSTPHTQKL